MPPRHLPRYAVLCLRALAKRGLGHLISIGGALGLMHYLDYRPTHYADAWWSSEATEEQKQQVMAVLEASLRPFGEVRTRTWGDVVSLDLLQEKRTVFSFQIASRSAQLEPSVTAPWTAVQLDSLEDLVASKMVALIERGAPRDFRDISAVCDAGLVTPDRCWELWLQHQRLAGGDTDRGRASLAIETHLERIALQRPLERVSDPAEREDAARLRAWFREVFLHAMP